MHRPPPKKKCYSGRADERTDKETKQFLEVALGPAKGSENIAYLIILSIFVEDFLRCFCLVSGIACTRLGGRPLEGVVAVEVEGWLMGSLL